MSTMNKKQETVLEVGQKYRIDGKSYLIDEKDFRKFYGYLLDESGNPYGRRRILGIKNKEIEKI